MNAAEALAGEIERVSTLRAEYRSLETAMAGTWVGRQVNLLPVIAMIDRSLERAKRAAGSNDAVEVIAAIKDLRGFTC